PVGYRQVAEEKIMANFSQSTNSKPYKRCGNSGLEFDPNAREVSILDRSGRAIWKQSSDESPAPIRWNGRTIEGEMVQTGDYICRIVYRNDKVAYLPFVFMKA